MADTFGARLRQHRERRNLSLAGVAEQTKIKASLLDGLERDDISQWPTGIFRRAYVKTYAAAIGYDADAAIREFLVLHPEPVEPSEPTPPPPRGLRGLVASALGSLRKPPSPQATTGERSAQRPVLDLAVAPAPRASVETAAIVAPAAQAPRAVPKPSAAQRSHEALTSAQLLAAARICTELGRVEDSGQIVPLLREAAKLLGARGLIVWVWDGIAEVLRPAIVHGYPSKVRARLRPVKAPADNVTAAAFRAGATLAVDSSDRASGALAVPLMGPAGCVGVLALELPDALEQDPTVRATATFLAAMLALLVGSAADQDTAPSPALGALEAQPG